MYNMILFLFIFYCYFYLQRTASGTSDVGLCWSRQGLRNNGRGVSPHGWVQCDSFRVIELQVQQDDTSQAIFTAHKNAVVHIIHKVEVSCQPVNSHLLHIWVCEREARQEESEEEYRGEREEDVFSVCFIFSQS